jgi:hypothetical protein
MRFASLFSIGLAFFVGIISLQGAFDAPLFAQEAAKEEPVAPQDPAEDAAPAAADVSSVDVEQEVRKQLRRLDADQLADRVAAEKALIELGPPALDYLPEVTPATAAEIKERLSRVRTALEKLAVARFVEPSPVTLSGTMTVEAAALELQKQTGNTLRDLGESATKQVTVAWDKTPFWVAFDDLTEQANLGINPFGGYEGELSLQALEETTDLAPIRSYAGIFRVQATRVQSARNLTAPGADNLRTTIQIAWEPRLKPISISLPLERMSATGEDGEELAFSREGVLGAPALSGVSTIDLDVPMQLPPRSVESIATLRGDLIATLPGRVEQFEFEDLAEARAVEKTRAGVKVVLEQVRKNQELYQVRIRVEFDEASGALESHQGWIYENKAWVETADGTKLDPLTFEATRQDTNLVGLAYYFDLEKGPQGAKFFYRTPASIVKRELPFELKNIPLP